MSYPTYEEKILETYGLTPAEFAAHEEDMREIIREEQKEERRRRYFEENAERIQMLRDLEDDGERWWE